jgi:hypothetical protein
VRDNSNGSVDWLTVIAGYDGASKTDRAANWRQAWMERCFLAYWYELTMRPLVVL